MNISRLDLNLLVVFDALMHERNVTRAAIRLNLSQPAVSHALQRLRDSLHDPLFVRNGRDMTPTPRAEALLPAIRPMLEGLSEAIYGNSFSPQHVDQTFSLALPDIAAAVILPALLPHLHAQAPSAKIAAVDIDLDQFQQQLVNGELDAAVIADVPLRPGMHKRVLAHEESNVGLVREGHPALRGKMTPERFRKIPRVAVTLSGGRVVSPVENIPEFRERMGEIIVSTPHFIVAASMLRQSDMVLVIGDIAGAALAQIFDLRTFKLPIELTSIDSVLVWHERTHRDPAQRWFRESILKTLEQMRLSGTGPKQKAART